MRHSAFFLVVALLIVSGGVLGQAREMAPGELANYVAGVTGEIERNTGERVDLLDRSPVQAPGWVADAEAAAQGWNTAGQVGSTASRFFGFGENLYDFLEAYDNLSPEDSGYDPDLDPDGGPQVPARCAVASSDCGACFTNAVDEINFIRFYLEKLRAIARSTIDMSRKAISFGDDASGFHGMMGLSWQLQGRPQIEEAVTKLRRTYVRKHGEYMGSLKTALQNLSRCEAEHFGEEDWYARYGFIYYEFMRSRYESPD